MIKKLVLDNKEDIIYEGRFGIALGDETLNFSPLQYLPVGLQKIAQEIKNIELIPENKKTVLKIFDFENEQAGHVYCMFHWFAVSLCNYMRIVKLVELVSKYDLNINNIKQKNMTNRIKDECREYTKSVIPEIYEWRNKVGAHFAVTDPYKDDNVATLYESSMPSFGLMHGRFATRVADLVKQGQDSKIPSWSLTEEYERLTPRFWPSRVLL